MKARPAPRQRFLLLAPSFGFTEEWRAAFSDVMPEVELVAPEALGPDEPEVAVVYDPPHGVLQRFPRLKAILALSAGIDDILSDPTLPPAPVVRLIHADIAQAMKEYVAYHVLRLHRDFAQFERRQQAALWEWPSSSSPAGQCRVSVLGLGQLGGPVARLLQAIGYDVVAWRRQPLQSSAVPAEWGPEGLRRVLMRADILVCLLPLTPLTRGILGRAAFEQMPKGARLVNVGRAACVVESELLEALDAGTISHATLDVFASEPLPASHPFWRHRRVTVTPHAAANLGPRACAEAIGQTLEWLDLGRPVKGLVDRALGY